MNWETNEGTMRNLLSKCQGYIFLYTHESNKLKNIHKVITWFTNSICPIMGGVLLKNKDSDNYMIRIIISVVLFLVPIIQACISFLDFNTKSINTQLVSRRYVTMRDTLSHQLELDYPEREHYNEFSNFITRQYNELLDEDLGISKSIITKYLEMNSRTKTLQEIPEIAHKYINEYHIIEEPPVIAQRPHKQTKIIF